MHHLLFGGVRVAVGNGGGCVEISPNVRKSAKLRAMEISRVKGERKVDVWGFPPGCTYCSCARTCGVRLVSVRVYLATATLSDRLHLQLRNSTFLTYTYAACRRPLRLIPHLSVRRSTGSTRPEDSINALCSSLLDYKKNYAQPCFL